MPIEDAQRGWGRGGQTKIGCLWIGGEVRVRIFNFFSRPHKQMKQQKKMVISGL